MLLTPNLSQPSVRKIKNKILHKEKFYGNLIER